METFHLNRALTHWWSPVGERGNTGRTLVPSHAKSSNTMSDLTPTHGCGAAVEQANKDTKAVAVVHNETATGITSDLPRIRETMDAAGSDALFLVCVPPYHP